MSFFQKTAILWQNIGIVQRALLASMVLAALLVSGLFIYWARIPEMKVLYSGLDPEEAAKITDKISEKGIVYKLSSAGTTIYVPQQHVSQLRLDMAKEGLPGTGQKGYSLFDDEKVGVSPFVQNVNLKRALQEELAKSIQMIDGVTHARVHIVCPENNYFSSSKSQTSASIILRLRPGCMLSPQNVAAICHIVTGSVEGLKAENVTIVDSQGRLLSRHADEALPGGAGTAADYRERIEQNLETKVQDMLTAVLGPGRASVKVSAEVDMTSINTAKETYDEGKRVATKEEITSESQTEGTKAASEGETAAGNTKKNETIITEYAVPKTVQQTVALAGEIKSLTVAAFVDLTQEEKPSSGDQTASAAPSAELIMPISEIEDIIRKAVGPKLAADGLKVVNVKFNRPAELLAEDESRQLDYIQIARHSSLGIMAICALIALKIFGGAGKKAFAESGGTLSAASTGSFAGLPAASPDMSESMMLRRQIAVSLQNNPQQVKQLFSSWLQEKGR